MASFATYINKLQDLTQKNLDILNLLNDSLYAKSNTVTSIIDNKTYSIPSFIYIENKLNDLEGNWNKLVSVPETGEAAFILNGTTKKIQAIGFENAPMPISIANDSIFRVERNDIFKDFMSPLIYMKYSLSDLPDNIKTVNVRKLVILNDTIASSLPSESVSWKEMIAALSAYIEGTDYIYYDKKYNLPAIVKDYVGNFEVQTIEYDSDLTSITATATFDTLNYTYNNETLTKTLVAGDTLITSDNNCKYRISSISNEIVEMYIESGYKKIVAGDILKFYKEEDTSNYKYIKVPLEEDRYIAIFIAPINDDINTQSSWSNGQLMDVDNLVDDSGNKFRDTYNSKIRNIGDILYDLTIFNSKTLSNISDDNLTALTEYKPSFGDYSVVLLNDHLLDNSSVEQIKKLNTQKAEINADLTSVQDNITKITNILATTDFSSQDTTTREDYEKSLSSYNTKREELISSLTSIINQITECASSNKLPANSSKFVITGGIKYQEAENTFKNTSGAKVIRFELLYRYKNINKEASSATTIDDAVTVSDWNKYIVDYRQKQANMTDTGIEYIFEENNSDGTTGRWATYQVPITQGETVDMRYRIQYDLGYPYVSTFSDWSETINVEFPDDLDTSNEITDIISNNKIDLRDNQIKQELISEGITTHINDKLIDQDLTYYHRPESIASGFYTEDTRRVISLKEKLYELTNEIESLKDGITNAAFGSNLKVNVVYNGVEYVLNPDGGSTTISIKSTDMTKIGDGSDAYCSIKIPITIYNNNSSSAARLYSMYPGDGSIKLSSFTYTSKWDLLKDDYEEALIKTMTSNTDTQNANQILYFRSKDRYSGDSVGYKDISETLTTNQLNARPYIPSLDSLQAPSSNSGDYRVINVGDNISIPIELKVLPDITYQHSTSRTVAFDLWTSPYREPVTYSVTFIIEIIHTSIIVSTTDE